MLKRSSDTYATAHPIHSQAARPAFRPSGDAGHLLLLVCPRQPSTTVPPVRYTATHLPPVGEAGHLALRIDPRKGGAVPLALAGQQPRHALPDATCAALPREAGGKLLGVGEEGHGSVLRPLCRPRESCCCSGGSRGRLKSGGVLLEGHSSGSC